MPLNFVPDNQEIIAILTAHVQGPYRVVHHAFVPYVRVAPATDMITVRSGPGLQLLADDGLGPRLRLQTGEVIIQVVGREAVLDFAVIFQGGGVVLQELGRRATMLDSIDPAHPLSHRPLPGTGVPRRSFSPPKAGAQLGTPQAQEVMEGGVTATPSTRQRKTRLVVAPPASPVTPPVSDIPVPELLAIVRQAEDLHPDLGDYVVIPESSVPPDEPLPPWAVRSPHVDVIHVHKPRQKG